MADSASEKRPLLPQGTQYASDDNQAENAREQDKGQDSGPQQPPTWSNSPRRNASETSLANAALRQQDDTIDFREDAKIWYLYLEDAELEAKERAELWRTGLDSLLIFAGLFAGVVSSFVIDARPELQLNSEQRILGDIRSVLASGSINDVLGVPTSARLISALWTLSLYITLFGSIMGVLAKAWLAKFVPATTRREAKDAYQRYALDQQAERWYLKEVLTLVPLLVQIASFLFLIGFVLQSYEDDLTIGHIIAVFCAAGGVLYIVMTVLPLFVSTSPFDTPFSDFLVWGRDLALALIRRKPFAELPSPVKKDINEGLAEILYYKLIKSPKQAHVDEAIAEVASTMFKDRWIVFLCQTETPQILLARFRYCAATSDMPTEQRNETLRNCLMVLLRFAETYDREVGPKIQESSEIPQGYRLLAATLRDSLEPENPLHRWNRLPEDLRPLLFSVRAAVLSLMPPSQVIDFSHHEISDRPWEMALQDIHSGHRFHFVLAACSGVFQEQPNLRTVGTAILALSLSRAASSALESGRITEWTGILHASERDRVYDLAPLLLSKLEEMTARRWEELILESELTISDVPSESTQRRTQLLTFLIDCLNPSNADWDLQCHAVHLLSSIQQYGTDALHDVKGPIHEHGLDSILTIAIQAMNDDEHPHTTDKAVMLLVNLSLPDYETHKLVQEKIIAEIKEGAGGDLYYSLGRQTIEFVSSCLRGRYLGFFYEWFPNVLPDLVRLGLRDYPSDSSSAVWELLPTEIAQDFNIYNMIPNYGEVVQQHILAEFKSILDGDDGWRQYRILHTVLEFLRNGFPPHDGLSTAPGFAFPWVSPEDLALDILVPSLPSIVKIASSGYASIGWSVAQDILRRSSTFALASSIPTLDALSLLESSATPSNQYEQRRAALEILHWHHSRLNLENPAVFRRFFQIACDPTDDDPFVRLQCLELLEVILRESQNLTDEAAEAINTVVTTHSSHILSESDALIQGAWIDLLVVMSKHSPLLETVPVFLNILAKDFGQRSHNVEEYFAVDLPPDGENESHQVSEPQTPQLPVRSTSRSEMHDAIEKGIPRDIRVSFSAPEGWERAAGWFELLLELQKLDGFSDIGSEIFGSAIDVVNRMAGIDCGEAEAVVSQTPQAGIQQDNLASRISPTQLLGDVTQQGDRASWIKILALLVRSSPTALPWVPELILRLAVEESDDEVRRTCVSSLIPLVELVELREPLSRHLTTYFSPIANKGNADVRKALAMLVGSFAGEEPLAGLNIDTLIHELLTFGWDDADSDVRHQAIDALFKLSGSQEGHAHGKQIAERAFAAKYEEGVSNQDWDSWLWLHLKARWLHSQEAHNISRLLDAFLEPDSSYYSVLYAATGVLADLLQQGEYQDSTANLLSQTLVAAIRKPDSQIRERAYALLGSLFSTAYPSDIPALYQIGELWLDIVIFLIRADESQVPMKILEKALKDIPNLKDGFLFLSGASDAAKSLEPLPVVLSRALSAALKADTSFSEDVRAAGTNLFTLLMDPTKGLADTSIGSSAPAVPGHLYSNEGSYITLLGRQNDALIISRLIESYVKESDFSRQLEAQTALEKAVRFQSARFSNLVKSALSKAVDKALLDTNATVRSSAIRVLDSLTVRLFDSTNTATSARFFRDEVLCPSLPHLLKMALVEMGGGSSSDLRATTRSLIVSHASKEKGSGNAAFSNALWAAIPSLVPNITVDGKATILELATDDLSMSSETAASVAKALVPVFRDGSSFARSTAIDLLSSLYSKHRGTQADLIDFAVPEIVAFALDEKDSVGVLRSTAISLLADILTLSHWSSDPVFKQVAPQAVKFMALLKTESLRSPTVKLMSVLASDSRVRKIISMRIVNLVISTVKTNEAMETYAELLSCLVAESRFLDEPTDYLVLNLLPTILGRQQFSPFRTIMLTSLWCHYGQNDGSTREPANYPADLVEWLKSAFFGRHATGYEVKMWSARCQGWLGSAAGADLNEELMLATPEEQTEVTQPGDTVQGDASISPDDVLTFDQWDFTDLTLESKHAIIYEDETYPTASHLFEAIKYLPNHPHIAHFFQTRPQDRIELLSEKNHYEPWIRQDWDSVAIGKLEEVLALKFDQHSSPKELLLDITQDRELCYRSGDYFLGDGFGAGRNELGKALMRLRSRLRKEQKGEQSLGDA